MSDDLLLTQAAFDRLMAELAQLMTVERGLISRKIQEAREEGDLKENGGYHAAKEEQGKLESRINRLQNMLGNAEIGEADPSDGVVKQGLVVSCKLNGSPMEFYLGSNEVFDGTEFQAKIDEGDLDVYSPDSPIGKAVVGQKVGSSVSFSAPNGKEIAVEISGLKNFRF
jgi:transcription elongation factor GreA